MSIEMDNPETPLEKADAIGNLLAQMFLANRAGDKKYFEEICNRAQDLCFELVNQLVNQLADLEGDGK